MLATFANQQRLFRALGLKLSGYGKHSLSTSIQSEAGLLSSTHRAQSSSTTNSANSRAHTVLDSFHGTARSFRLGQTQRWVGVTVRHARYEAWVTHMKQKCTIARFQTKEEAARVHDEACIYQGKAPENFPVSAYDVADIQKHESFKAFLCEKRQMASAAVKALQHSSYTNVSRRNGKYVAYTWMPSLFRGHNVNAGPFDSEVEAAEAADALRVQLGKPAVNFPGEHVVPASTSVCTLNDQSQQ